MRRSVAAGCLFAIAVLGLGASGCGGPTYRRDEIPKAIQEICAREYQLNATVRLVGRTVSLVAQKPGLFEQLGGEIVGLSESTPLDLSRLVEAIQRVILSADQPPEFYLVLACDPAAQDTCLMMVQYVDDVRRVQASMIPLTEYLARRILEFHRSGTSPGDVERWLSSDIQFEQFLSWQLANRIQTRLSEAFLRQGWPPSDIGPCLGEFREGEFAFTLNVVRPLEGTDRDGVVQQVFEEATQEIADVLASYRFEDFDRIRLILPASGRDLLLPKAQLDLIR